MLRYLILGLLAIVLLSACTAAASDQLVTENELSRVVIVYKSPT